MKKRWLTDQPYNLYGALIRIIYWLVAIYLSSLYLQKYSETEYQKVGLMLISFIFVVLFIFVTRISDHFFKFKKG